MSGPKPKPFECPEPVFWYLVGLIASDGCLSSDGRHIDITSKDRDCLEQIRKAASLSCRVGQKNKRGVSICHHLQIGSRVLYDRLLAIGLTPKKSLTLGPLQVPDSVFHDFLRGVIDGDGGIRRWQHPSNGREQWTLRISSASHPFATWLETTIARLWRVHGRVHSEQRGRHHILYKLKYGKLAARVLIEKCYYRGALSLERKQMLAEQCTTVSVGWSKSKTVEEAHNWDGWTYTRINARGTKHGPADPTAGLVSDWVARYFAGVAQLAQTRET